MEGVGLLGARKEGDAGPAAGPQAHRGGAHDPADRVAPASARLPGRGGALAFGVPSPDGVRGRVVAGETRTPPGRSARAGLRHGRVLSIIHAPTAAITHPKWRPPRSPK